MTNHSNDPGRTSLALERSSVPGTARNEQPQAWHGPIPAGLEPGSRARRRWVGENPAGAIELSDAELRDALKTAPICTKYASISTTWCDNPNAC